MGDGATLLYLSRRLGTSVSTYLLLNFIIITYAFNSMGLLLNNCYIIYCDLEN